MADLQPLTPPASPFAWHRDALAGKRPAIDPEKPQIGYYRRPLPDGTWQRVVIWMDGPDLVAIAEGQRVDPKAIWPHAALNPVRFEDHEFVVREGYWPDQPKPMVGHNQGPPLDDEDAEKFGADFAAVRKTATALLAEAAKAVAEPDKQDADAISLLVDKLGAVATQADTFHGHEKKPFLERGRLVDDRWRTLREVPRNAVAQLKATILTPAARKRAREAFEAQMAARAAANEQSGGPAGALPITPVAKVTVGQGTGARKKTLKEVRIAVVVDQDALYQALKNDPLVVETLQSLASKVIKAGGTLPGVEVRIEERV